MQHAVGAKVVLLWETMGRMGGRYVSMCISGGHNSVVFVVVLVLQ